MTLRTLAVVTLAGARGAAAQCTALPSGFPPSNAADTACCAAAGYTTSACRYTCDFGYTDTGAQPSCTGSTWSAGSMACGGAWRATLPPAHRAARRCRCWCRRCCQPAQPGLGIAPSALLPLLVFQSKRAFFDTRCH